MGKCELKNQAHITDFSKTTFFVILCADDLSFNQDKIKNIRGKDCTSWIFVYQILIYTLR